MDIDDMWDDEEDIRPFTKQQSAPKASPASVPEGVVEWMQNIDSAVKEPIFQEARALMGTENYGQDVSLLQALRLVRRRMLAAAPTPPAEDQKDAEILNRMQLMCEESLDPETFGKWEEVKTVLITTRKEFRNDKRT